MANLDDYLSMKGDGLFPSRFKDKDLFNNSPKSNKEGVDPSPSHNI
jgi:hypothetical protein